MIARVFSGLILSHTLAFEPQLSQTLPQFSSFSAFQEAGGSFYQPVQIGSGQEDLRALTRNKNQVRRDSESNDLFSARNKFIATLSAIGILSLGWLFFLTRNQNNDSLQ